MNHVTEFAIARCACGTTNINPWTTCWSCQRVERAHEEQRWREGAEEVRALCLDRYAFNMLAVRADGTFLLVRDAMQVLNEGSRKHHDDLIRDLTALRKENTELLAENARMRRRLEQKR